MEPALGIRRCPLVQLALEVKYPLLRHLDARERRARIHRRPPPVQSCCVLTGPLRPAPGFPALPGALLPRLLRSSATSRRQQRTVRLPQTPKASAGTAGTLPTFTTDRSAGSAPSSTPGASSRATATRRATSTARSETDGQDDPQHNRGPSTPTAHSRQFPGCCPSLGASNTGSSPTPFCFATAPDPLAADRCSIVKGCSRPPPHLWLRLPLSFTRPSRRPGAGSLTPPGHMAPRGALPLCL